MKSIVALVLSVFALSGLATAQTPKDQVVDFRYRPADWQTTICLPDDPFKSIVGKNGDLLYHYGEKNREFATTVRVEVVGDAVWQSQRLVSSKVPIVKTLSKAPELDIEQEAFAVTDIPGREKSPLSRNDLILVWVHNTGAQSKVIHPIAVVDTAFDVKFVKESQQFIVNGLETVSSSLKMNAVTTHDSERRIELDELTIKPGKTVVFYVGYNGGGRIVPYPTTIAQALTCRKKAESYWAKSRLPWGRVQVPDPSIQYLVDTSIRNIWQARERKKGLPVFQVGPTCYRGLWIVDGSFILETATLLGAGAEARNGIAYTLSLQNADGSFSVLSPIFYKENGIVIWTCVRHAMLTQDKAWLTSIWPKLIGAAEQIKRLRQQSFLNGMPGDDGMNPPGDIDGGLGANGKPEFSNAHWNLTGLHALIQAAHWLGKDSEARSWQAEYDDFYRAFREATDKNAHKDPNGNAYVPIRVDNVGNELPQRAQWTFCHAIYPGQVFAKDDPLVASTLKMLQDTEREGMVYGTGWNPTGIWNYFASFYGHAWLWQGNGQKAADVLYAFANHASPIGAWREEQNLVNAPYDKVGDMPHNWASAEFIRLTIHLLALDRGDELHLLEGFPKAWAGPGMVTRLDGVSTPFGKLFMTVKVSKDGRAGTVTVKPLASNCKQIVVHLPDGSARILPADQGGTVKFRLKD